MSSFGPLHMVGVEGTGAYGVGLARYLHKMGIEVVEVDRPKPSDPSPDRQVRSCRCRRGGPCGAGQVLGPPGPHRDSRPDPSAELHRPRRDPRASERFASKALWETCVSFRPRRSRRSSEVVGYATKVALGALGQRIEALEEEIATIDALLDELVAAAAPSLLALYGVGVDTGATLLVTAGDNPERLRSEAAFAALCGVAPIEASPGKVVRHRLNRGGDRYANSGAVADCHGPPLR